VLDLWPLDLAVLEKLDPPRPPRVATAEERIAALEAQIQRLAAPTA
jgi:hypothetical protein